MVAEHVLAELQQPGCYPDAGGAAAVEVLQTHLSVVCLVGERAYKLKKARRFPFVDFSALPARRAACRDEVRLNRRLCPDVYLGTAALRRTAAGLRFAALGDDDGPEDLDVAVVMQRLPADRMLDVLLQHGEVTNEEIEQLAQQVARFHAAAARGGAVASTGAPHHLIDFAAANFTELDRVPAHGLPKALLHALARTSAADFVRLLPELEARVDRHVVDGHGDLHARNVCMTEPPSVYDCIEFEPAFRCGDVATESAFLLMDLRYRGARSLARTYVAAYVAASGDAEMATLLPPLMAYRAMVRAKVSALVAAEPELSAADRHGARESALRHLVLAAGLALEWRGPLWLVACGPPASGKSSVLGALAASLQWPLIATDCVRKELAGVPPTARGDVVIYRPEFSDHTYREVGRRAAAATAAGEPVVLIDGNFATPVRRAEVRAAAAECGATVRLLFVDTDAETAARRAARREASPTAVSDAGSGVAAAVRRRFVVPSTEEVPGLLRLDGSAPVEAVVTEALTGLLQQALQ